MKRITDSKREATLTAIQINLIELINDFFNFPGAVTRDDLKIYARKNNCSSAVVQKLDEILVDAYTSHEWDCLKTGHWSFKYAQKGRTHIGIAGAPARSQD